MPIFENGTFLALTAKGSESYVPYLGSFIAGEIVFNTVILIASIYLIYLFFSKKHFFPKLYICVAIVSLIFIPLDAWVATKVFPGEPMFDIETMKEFGRSLISCAIWVPYMFFSKRVKATFIENMSDK